MNEHFPNWFTANILLEELVDGFWKVEVKQSRFIEDASEISFLAPEIVSAIPPEDRETFKSIYQKFGVWAYDFLREQLEKYLYLVNTPSTWSEMKNEINLAFAEAGIDPKEKLKEMLGLRTFRNIEFKTEFSHP